MRAAVLHEFHKPLVVEQVEVDEPRAGEVLVRIAASGVCRSDLHVAEDRSPVARLPMVLGHEGAGVVEQTGAGVSAVRRGDPVVIALYGPCGTCEDCRAGDIPRCASSARQNGVFGLMADGSTRLHLRGQPVHPMVGSGSLAEYALVRESQLVRIDPDIPLACACLAGCGVTTGLGAALNTAQVQPGSSVAVIGCGGVGLNVVQGARIAGAARIIAVDPQRSKLDLAADLGATDFVRVEPGMDVVAAIRALVPRGVDYAFEVIGAPEVVRQAFAATREGGTAVMVGAPPPGTDIALDSRLLFADRRLLGCMGGGNVPQRDIPRIMRLYKQGALKLEPLISQRLGLDQVNVAFDALRSGELARSVVTP
jgi:S-(hydroxymethyl)glutathione dehydrogenase/alcohol dehydrogenase